MTDAPKARVSGQPPYRAVVRDWRDIMRCARDLGMTVREYLASLKAS